jgi:cysteinyl-tRNA synthetase
MASAEKKLRLYNTLTRETMDFAPLDPGNVRMYVCGPTVYDYAHIGNARPVIVFDVLYRLLRHLYGAEHVTYVRNITDVDDKINARAARDFPGLPLNEAIRKVTEKTAAQFEKDVAALGTLRPDFEPRATENIEEMQRLIADLIQRGHAYEAGGEVLFAVDSMPDYGALSGRNLEDQKAGARVAVDAHKHNPADFVLWKLSSAHEPGWESPWGRGRPGWHIECSAMSERYLGQTFDIHGGGLDLIFPHHENEIAQSRCAHGTDVMAQVWMHNGFLQVEGQKMSKSLGNFITIHDLLETEKFGGRKWPGEVLRLAMLMTHYREPIDFSVARLEEAEQQVDTWMRILEDFVFSRVSPEFLGSCFEAAQQDNSEWNLAVEVLKDDLAFPTLMVRLRELPSEVRRFGDNPQGWSKASELLGVLDNLGLISLSSFLTWKAERSLQGAAEEQVKQKVEARLAALTAKDFATADAIRSELAQAGVALMDYKDETGARRTRWEVKR